MSELDLNALADSGRPAATLVAPHVDRPYASWDEFHADMRSGEYYRQVYGCPKDAAQCQDDDDGGASSVGELGADTQDDSLGSSEDLLPVADDGKQAQEMNNDRGTRAGPGPEPKPLGIEGCTAFGSIDETHQRAQEMAAIFEQLADPSAAVKAVLRAAAMINGQRNQERGRGRESHRRYGEGEAVCAQTLARSHDRDGSIRVVKAGESL